MRDAYPNGRMTEVHVHGAHATVRSQGFEDEVAVEEPLEIRVDGAPLAVTMRTPGHDEELAVGFLFGEGLIDGPRAAGPPTTRGQHGRGGRAAAARAVGARSFYTSSSCGVCGKGALEEVAVDSAPAAAGPVLERGAGGRPARAPAPADVRPHRRPARDRAVHARRASWCACARTSAATTRWTRSIGWALREGRVPLHPHVLCVSGRLSFELVQKAAVAGAPMLVGVGAPTSLAVRLAEDRGMTLAGFARGGRVNVYTRAETGAMTFEAVVQTEDEGVFVELPPDSEFARARAPVTVTINGADVGVDRRRLQRPLLPAAAARGSARWRTSSPATPSPSSSRADRAELRLEAVELERPERVEALVLGAVEVGRAGEQEPVGRAVQRLGLLLRVRRVEASTPSSPASTNACSVASASRCVVDVPERVRPDGDAAGGVDDLDRLRHGRPAARHVCGGAGHQVGREQGVAAVDPLVARGAARSPGGRARRRPGAGGRSACRRRGAPRSGASSSSKPSSRSRSAISSIRRARSPRKSCSDAWRSSSSGSSS